MALTALRSGVSNLARLNGLGHAERFPATSTDCLTSMRCISTTVAVSAVSGRYLLPLDGEDLREHPLSYRKLRLRRLVLKVSGRSRRGGNFCSRIRPLSRLARCHVSADRRKIAAVIVEKAPMQASRPIKARQCKTYLRFGLISIQDRYFLAGAAATHAPFLSAPPFGSHFIFAFTQSALVVGVACANAAGASRSAPINAATEEASLFYPSGWFARN
jgi:hypothetical protein